MKIIVQSRSFHFPLSRVSQLVLYLRSIIRIWTAETDRKREKKRRIRTKKRPRFRANEPLQSAFPSILAYGSQDSHKIEQTSNLGERGISWPSAARVKSSVCRAQSLELSDDQVLACNKRNIIMKHISLRGRPFT